MKLNRRQLIVTLTLSVLLTMSGAVSLLRADNGTCHGVNTSLPFTDVAGNGFFCFIAEAYFAGLAAGTTATTYSPADGVTRGQMAVFISRTLDQSLRRGSRRAALGQWWTQQSILPSALTPVGSTPVAVRSDGKCLWVANSGDSTVTRVRASDGQVVETWTGMDSPVDLLIANGRVYVSGGAFFGPGKLYAIDPAQPAGNATLVADLGGDGVGGMAYDGEHILIAHQGSGITVYDVLSGSFVTYKGNFGAPTEAVYDGSAFWVTEGYGSKIRKVAAAGQILQTVEVGQSPARPVFDGTNLWVPNQGSSSVTVVRAATGAVVATLTGNGLIGPVAAAFDGERILVTNYNYAKSSVSLWRATDFAPLGSFPTGEGTDPVGACSDGLNFWITLSETGKLARF